MASASVVGEDFNADAEVAALLCDDDDVLMEQAPPAVEKPTIGAAKALRCQLCGVAASKDINLGQLISWWKLASPSPNPDLASFVVATGSKASKRSVFG